MYAWWQARFGGDRSVIGRDMIIDGIAREVIGVMPATFRLLDMMRRFYCRFSSIAAIIGSRSGRLPGNCPPYVGRASYIPTVRAIWVDTVEALRAQ
jgi:hypothetical protein